MRRLSLALLVVLLSTFIASSAAQQRKHAVAPEPPFVFHAAVDYFPTQGAISRVFGPLPVGSSVERVVIRPDGSEAFHSQPSKVSTFVSAEDALVSVGGFADLWSNPQPADWPDGITIYRAILTRNGQTYTVSRKVAKNVVLPPDDSPLEGVVVDSAGGIRLLYNPLFFTPPTIVSSARVGMLPLQGMDYIPSSANLPLPTDITGCRGKEDANHIECSSQVAHQ